MRASLALAVLTGGVLGTVVGVSYGARDGVLTALLLGGLGALVLLTAHATARRGARRGSLRRRFALVAAIVVGQIVVVAAVSAQLMFVSAHDALFVMAVALLCGVVAVRAGQVFAADVLRDVDSLRDTLAAVGDGLREPVPVTRSQDELAALAGAANATIVKLDRAERARADMVAAVSHDLRTPITSLQLLVQAVDDGIVDGPTQARYLRQMNTHVRALSALIDDLFELSRVEAGELNCILEQIPVDQLVGETVEAMRPQAEAGCVALEARLPHGGAVARADPEKVQRVLFNLLQNAIRHTPADGSVTVLAEPRGGGVEIEVADTGEGIAEADRVRVFEPFFRGGSEAARTRTGSGLGLAVSRAIVEAHGGRIWLEEAAAGTRVRFFLPGVA